MARTPPPRARLLLGHGIQAPTGGWWVCGEEFYYHDDGVRTLQPGQLLVCDADRPLMRGFSQGLEELVLKVPHDVFAEATGIAALPRPFVVPFGSGENPYAEALARLVGSTVREDDPAVVHEGELLELVGALASPGRSDGPAAYAAAARAYVERHLRDRALSASESAPPTYAAARSSPARSPDGLGSAGPRGHGRGRAARARRGRRRDQVVGAT